MELDLFLCVCVSPKKKRLNKYNVSNEVLDVHSPCRYLQQEASSMGLEGTFTRHGRKDEAERPPGK